MIPRSFQYIAPTSRREVLSILKRYGRNSKILAGGMSMIPVMKLRLASPTYVIDINMIRDLEYVKQQGKNLVLGALARHHLIESSKLVRDKVPLLAETAGWIGDPQVRNMGTIGGSLSHCDPSGDLGAAVTALRAEVEVSSLGKKRIVKIDDFFVDTFTTVLKPYELLTQVRIPIPGPKSGFAYMKLERKAGDFPTVGVAIQITLDSQDTCTYAGIGLSAVGPKNLRAKKAENLLLGRKLTHGVMEEVAETAAQDTQPTPDPIRGSIEFKKEMTKVLTRRGLSIALAGAKGGH
jgi:carbon-monoxide dehydrogenase medium subunit